MYDQTPAVHFQFMTDREIAEKLFNSNKPFLASIVPDLLDKSLKTEEGGTIYGRIHPPENYYPDWAIDIFKENKDNPNVFWVQEGYRHCCERCFKEFEKHGGKEKNAWPDPWHEHVCLDGYAQSLEKQLEVMGRGEGSMKDKLGITPIGYGPPNHLYNEDTLEAVRNMNFKYFMTKNGFDYFIPSLIDLPAYEDNGLIIIPESNLGIRTKSPVSLTYYDHLEEGQWDEFKPLLESSVKLSELPISEKPKGKVWMNEKLITTFKRLRDLKKRVKK